MNGVKIEARHRVIEDVHESNDAELDKGWLSGWREEWMPSRYSLEMKMDGLVIGLAMDINGFFQGRFIYSKQVIEALGYFLTELILTASLNRLTVANTSSLTGKIKTHPMMVFCQHIWFTG